MKAIFLVENCTDENPCEECRLTDESLLIYNVIKMLDKMSANLTGYNLARARSAIEKLELQWERNNKRCEKIRSVRRAKNSLYRVIKQIGGNLNNQN